MFYYITIRVFNQNQVFFGADNDIYLLFHSSL